MIAAVAFWLATFAQGAAAAPSVLAPPVAPTLVAISNDPWAQRAAVLERQLAQTEADVLRLEIERANLVATVQERDHRIESMEFSTRVQTMLEKYTSLFGGTWYWDSGANKPAQKKNQESK